MLTKLYNLAFTALYCLWANAVLHTTRGETRAPERLIAVILSKTNSECVHRMSQRINS